MVKVSLRGIAKTLNQKPLHGITGGSEAPSCRLKRRPKPQGLKLLVVSMDEGKAYGNCSKACMGTNQRNQILRPLLAINIYFPPDFVLGFHVSATLLQNHVLTAPDVVLHSALQNRVNVELKVRP